MYFIASIFIHYKKQLLLQKQEELLPSCFQNLYDLRLLPCRAPVEPSHDASAYREAEGCADKAAERAV